MDQAKSQGISKFMNSHFFAGEAGSKEITMFFNNLAPHSIATAVNMASNAVLKSIVGSDYNIQTLNHPLPPTVMVYYPFGEEFILDLCMSVGCLLYLSVFIIYPIEDNITGSKHLVQLAAGRILSFYKENYELFKNSNYVDKNISRKCIFGESENRFLIHTYF